MSKDYILQTIVNFVVTSKRRNALIADIEAATHDPLAALSAVTASTVEKATTLAALQELFSQYDRLAASFAREYADLKRLIEDYALEVKSREAKAFAEEVRNGDRQERHSVKVRAGEIAFRSCIVRDKANHDMVFSLLHLSAIAGSLVSVNLRVRVDKWVETLRTAFGSDVVFMRKILFKGEEIDAPCTNLHAFLFLVLRLKAGEAKEVATWLFNEVLPAYYGVQRSEFQRAIRQAKELKELEADPAKAVTHFQAMLAKGAA